MSFKVGSIYAVAELDTKDYDDGARRIESSTNTLSTYVRTSFGKMGKDTNDFFNDFREKAKTSANRSSDYFKGFGNVLRAVLYSDFLKIKKGLSDMANAAHRNFNAMRQSAIRFRTTTRLLQDAFAPLAAVARMAGMAFAVVTTAMADAMQISDAYIRSLSNVLTIMTPGDTKILNVSKAILNMNKELGDSIELANGMYMALSSGADTAAEALETTKVAAMFSKAALTSIPASVDIITTAINAYGKETMSATKASDILFKTIDEGKITGQDLVMSLGKSIPVFSTVGIKMEELAAGMTTMTQMGVRTREATTQLNGIINAFLKPSRALSQVFKEQGIESGAVLLKTKGLVGAMDLLKTAAGGNATTLKALLPNMWAMRGAMALGIDDGKLFAEQLVKMGDAAGSTERAFSIQEKTYATFSATLKDMKILFGNIANFLGHKMAADLTKLVKGVQTFLKSKEGLKAIANIGASLQRHFDALSNAFFRVTKNLNIFKDGADGIDQKISKAVMGLVDAGTAVSKFGFYLMKGKVEIKGFYDYILLQVDRFKFSLDKIGAQIKELLPGNGDADRAEVKKYTDIIDSIDEGVEKLKKDKDKELAILDKKIEGMEAFRKAYIEELKKIPLASTKVWFSATESILYGTAEMQDRVTSADKKFLGDRKKAFLKGLKEAGFAIKEGIDDLDDIDPPPPPPLKGWDVWAKYVKDNLTTVYDTFKFVFDGIESINNELFKSISTISTLYFGNELAKADKKLKTEQEQIETAKELQLKTIEDTYNIEVDLLNDKLDKGLISQEAFEAAMKVLNDNKATQEVEALETSRIANEKALKEKNALAEKSFKMQKALSIAEVWMNHASAVMGFWSSMAKAGPPGWIMAGVMSGINLTTAIAQTSLISQQEFVPAYAAGTSNHPGGIALVGEKGPELVNLPSASQVIPADISRDILKSSRIFQAEKSNTINITITNPVIDSKERLNELVSKVERELGYRMKGRLA